MTTREKSGGGCWKFFAAGCGCLVLIVVLLVAAALVSVPWLGEKFDEAKGAFNEMMSIRAALQGEFSTSDVEIGRHYRSGEGSTLRITLVDPSFFDDPRVDLEAKAREVAIFAKPLLDDPAAWTSIDVTLKRTGTSSSILSATHDFSFRVDELPDSDEPDVSPEGPDASPDGTGEPAGTGDVTPRA